MALVKRTGYLYVERPASGQRTSTHALEQIVFDPNKVEVANRVAARFASTLRLLRERENLEGLCFFQIDGYPAGAIALMQQLVAEVGVPAGVWSRKDEKIRGYQPQPGARVAIVYDACVTGATLLEVGKSLHNSLGLSIVAAVVFVNFNNLQSVEDKTFGFALMDVARSADMIETLDSRAASISVGEDTHGTVGVKVPSLISAGGMKSTQEEQMSENNRTTPHLFWRLTLRSLPLLVATVIAGISFGGNFPARTLAVLFALQVALSIGGLYLWFKMVRR